MNFFGEVSADFSNLHRLAGMSVNEWTEIKSLALAVTMKAMSIHSLTLMATGKAISVHSLARLSTTKLRDGFTR